MRSLLEGGVYKKAAFISIIKIEDIKSCVNSKQ